MQKNRMTTAFYITFWVAIIILLIISTIYTIYAYNSVGEYKNFDQESRLVEARDLLLWSAILYGIGLLLVVIFMIGAIAFKWESTYNKHGFVFLLHTFLFIWFSIIIILLVLAMEHIDVNSNTLSSDSLQKAVRDIRVAIITGSALPILIGGAYLGYTYHKARQRYYCKQNYFLNELQRNS